MMADLLKEDAGAICKLALEGLSEDWVQGLVENVTGLQEGE